MSTLDETLRQITASWQAVARYSVVRIRRGVRTVIAQDQTWLEATALRAVEEKKIQADPDYRAVMSRTVVAVELEKPNHVTPKGMQR